MPESPNTILHNELGVVYKAQVLTIENIIRPSSEVGGECDVMTTIRKKKTIRQWVVCGARLENVLKDDVRESTH